ncbi:MAG TPA: class I SAM-dependent methyltransferase [Acidimicrobiia bacterium]|nr:class I SAM-dependent methyltransferase [Acidimicrobiia bacterium]
MDREDWNDRYRATELVWTADANRFVVAEVADLPPGRALDLAAGEGRNAIWLAERGWRTSAVDFSDVALDKARALAESRGVSLETIVADVTTYEAAPGAYDLVLVAYLQLPEPARSVVLRRATDAVAPGGTLLVIAHDRSNLDGGYGGPQDPTVLATPAEVAAALTDLDVVTAELVERTVDTPDGPRVAVDHLVRARRDGADRG